MAEPPDVDPVARKARWEALATAALAGIVVGVPIAAAWIVVGGSRGTAVAIAGIFLFAAGYSFLRARYLVPRRLRSYLPQLVDPGASAPADAVPVDRDEAQRISALMDGGERHALAELLTDDVVIGATGSGRPCSRRAYIRTCQLMRVAYPGRRTIVEEVRARPEDPSRVWVRTRSHGTPRRGPALDVTSWACWTLAPDGRISAITDSAIVRVR